MWGERVSQSRVACKGIMATTSKRKRLDTLEGTELIRRNEAVQMLKDLFDEKQGHTLRVARTQKTRVHVKCCVPGCPFFHTASSVPDKRLGNNGNEAQVIHGTWDLNPAQTSQSTTSEHQPHDLSVKRKLSPSEMAYFGKKMLKTGKLMRKIEQVRSQTLRGHDMHWWHENSVARHCAMLQFILQNPDDPDNPGKNVDMTRTDWIQNVTEDVVTTAPGVSTANSLRSHSMPPFIIFEDVQSTRSLTLRMMFALFRCFTVQSTCVRSTLVTIRGGQQDERASSSLSPTFATITGGQQIKGGSRCLNRSQRIKIAGGCHKCRSTQAANAQGGRTGFFSNTRYLRRQLPTYQFLLWKVRARFVYVHNPSSYLLLRAWCSWLFQVFLLFFLAGNSEA